MKPDPSNADLSQKRAVLPRLVVSLFRVLRLFWFTELLLLGVLLYGLYAGWSARRQWSDAYFLAAAAQFVSAGIAVYGGTGQTIADSSTVRYVNDGDLAATNRELILDYLRKMKFGVRLVIGGLLTLLVSGLFLWG